MATNSLLYFFRTHSDFITLTFFIIFFLNIDLFLYFIFYFHYFYHYFHYLKHYFINLNGNKKWNIKGNIYFIFKYIFLFIFHFFITITFIITFITFNFISFIIPSFLWGCILYCQVCLIFCLFVSNAPFGTFLSQFDVCNSFVSSFYED